MLSSSALPLWFLTLLSLISSTWAQQRLRCFSGQFKQQPISNSAANDALNAWYSGLGCSERSEAVHMPPHGSISKEVGGVLVRAIAFTDINVACGELYDEFRQVIDKCIPATYRTA